MIIKGFHKTPAGILVNGGELVELLRNNSGVVQAGGRNEFDIDLDALSGPLHGFIGFGNVFVVWRVDGYGTLFFKGSGKVQGWSGQSGAVS